jgi:hypothetical protein
MLKAEAGYGDARSKLDAAFDSTSQRVLVWGRGVQALGCGERLTAGGPKTGWTTVVPANLVE